MLKATCKKRIIWALPFGLLVLEILAFYAVSGWGIGTGIPKRPGYSNLQSDILFCYLFGVFTFIFFTFFLPTDTIKHPFLLATTIFIIVALPSFFMAQAVTDTLYQYRMLTRDYYFQALEECWKSRAVLLPAFLPHLFAFILALALRKAMRALWICLKSIIKSLNP